MYYNDNEDVEYPLWIKILVILLFILVFTVIPVLAALGWL